MKQFILKVAFFLASCTGYNHGAIAQTDNALLWRISGNGLEKPSYLFGTAHLVCPGEYLWTDKMDAAFNESEELCLEMNITDQAELGKYMAGITNTTGRQLETYFTPQQYKEAGAYFKDSLHTDIAQFASLKPIALAGILEMKSMDCPAPASYEHKLIAAAKEKKKQIAGLEDATETIAIISHIDADSIIAGLMDLVHNKQDSRKYTRQIMDAYQQQDITTISTIARGQLHDKADELLDDRNARWVARMSGKMKQRQVFFAVGAGHLADEKGVIALLRKAGYKVEAVK